MLIKSVHLKQKREGITKVTLFQGIVCLCKPNADGIHITSLPLPCTYTYSVLRTTCSLKGIHVPWKPMLAAEHVCHTRSGRNMPHEACSQHGLSSASNRTHTTFTVTFTGSMIPEITFAWDSAQALAHITARPHRVLGN
jgi:hypothetical protein